MLSMYPACFYHEKNGYSVVFPDLNWLSTCGETLNEAMSMAVDCCLLYTSKSEEAIEWMERGLPLSINEKQKATTRAVLCFLYLKAGKAEKRCV